MERSHAIITRAAAKAAGLTRYFTGKMCPKGHIVEHIVANWTCAECVATRPRQPPPPRKHNHKRAAKLACEAMYSTGKPCRNGHMAERHTETGRCSACLIEHDERHRINAAKHYEEHKDEINARSRMSRPRRPKFIAKSLGLEHYETGKPCGRGHIDKRRVSDGMCLSCVNLAQYVWNKNNPEAARAIVIRRRARRLNASGFHTADQVKSLMTTQKGKCAYCKTSIKKKWHVDHIYPLAKGGSNDISNIQLTCPRCNQRKNAKHPIKFAQELGFLL